MLHCNNELYKQLYLRNIFFYLWFYYKFEMFGQYILIFIIERDYEL